MYMCVCVCVCVFKKKGKESMYELKKKSNLDRLKNSVFLKLGSVSRHFEDQVLYICFVCYGNQT